MNITQKKLEKSKGNLELFLDNHKLQKLYQKGSLKAFMPDFHENLKHLMLLNTAGGITSGDEFNYDFKIDNSKICPIEGTNVIRVPFGKKFSKKKRPEKNQNIATLILPLSSYTSPTPPHVA